MAATIRVGLLLLSVTFTGSADPALTETVRRGVVWITAESAHSEGAGIVVHQSEQTVLVLTARHVVAAGTTPLSSISVHYYGKPSSPCPGIVEAVARAADLALVRVPPCSSVDQLPAFPRFVVRGDPGESERVWALGHAGDNRYKPTAQSTVLEGEVTVASDGVRINTFRFDARGVVKGFSGGPVLTESGELVGMTIQQTADSGIALKIDSVLALLRGNFNLAQTSQIQVERNRPSDLDTLRVRLGHMQVEAEELNTFFSNRRRMVVASGGQWRSAITSALQAVAVDLQEAGSALNTREIVRARRALEAAGSRFEELRRYK